MLGRAANAAALAALRARLHLDAPVALRFWRWLTDLLRGDLGVSLVNGQDVSALVMPRLARSAVLLGIAAIVGAPLSLAAGVLAAFRQGSRLDATLCVITLAVAALPEFVVGMGLIVLLATLVVQWLPPVSMTAPGEAVLRHPVIRSCRRLPWCWSRSPACSA